MCVTDSASAYIVDRFVLPKFRSREEQEANADLIAASPAMLEALQRLEKVDLIWAWNPKETVEQNCNRLRKEIAAVASAAITLAQSGPAAGGEG